jgi:ribonuclease BN (tRNA processing enzyme)
VIRTADVLGKGVPSKKLVILGDTCDSSSMVFDDESHYHPFEKDQYIGSHGAMDCDFISHEATFHKELSDKAANTGHSTTEMAGR